MRFWILMTVCVVMTGCPSDEPSQKPEPSHSREDKRKEQASIPAEKSTPKETVTKEYKVSILANGVRITEKMQDGSERHITTLVHNRQIEVVQSMPAIEHSKLALLFRDGVLLVFEWREDGKLKSIYDAQLRNTEYNLSFDHTGRVLRCLGKGGGSPLVEIPLR